MCKYTYKHLTILSACVLFGACSAWGPVKPIREDQAQQCIQQFRQAPASSDHGLASGINLLNWNLQKGSQPGWETQLRALSRHRDLLLIQEAVNDNGLTEPLAYHRHRHFAPGYHTGSQQTGVLTASRVAPLDRCNLASLEPWLGTPKATAITRFAIENSNQHLLVANIHGVNFSLGVAHYQRQLQDVVAVLAEHRGPIIFAGDFNTWNGRRLALLEAAAQRLSLTAVTFTEDRRRRFLGRPLGHILVRGLTAIDSDAPATEFSDHNPMLVSLTWKQPLHDTEAATLRHGTAVQPVAAE
ncbi:endonuclease/exonuclease/phosphatase family protein [Exilibacterium tricleocarpae]|uniref:Endonuclease/exonuclease/phosphatase family protein n=1 Tax=Exilibacterium tricleocarpae TaxID=2591008 RepID=A0A545SXJ0_9GAMM|nr:endonuclease/exonuclease/phosphatase family protein [Exilibacterium tricleocarpae]TQV69671.1 endonuclease/exonuclease/phosphatase family protein [Exilibacterium tricleocarpae]